MARHTVWGSFEFDAPDRLGTILLGNVVVSIGLGEARNSNGSGNFDEEVCLFSFDPLGTIVWDMPVVSIGLGKARNSDGSGDFDEGVCLFCFDPLGTIVCDMLVVSIGLSEAVDLDGADILDARGVVSPQNCQRVSFLTISGFVGVTGRDGRVDGAGTVGL